jgi:tetratricopeptide (TPR) repeat protein
MKRFSRLEFGESRKESKDKRPHGESIRDEFYFQKRALQCWLAGDFELALRNYSRALEKNSSFFEGWTGQILMLIELGEYHEAGVWSDKALEMFPEHPELLALKAVACVRDGRIEKALAYSDNAISKERVTPRVWLSRAEVLMKRKSLVADNCISKAIGLAGNEAPIIRLEAGRLLAKKEHYSRAVQYLQEVVTAIPKSAMAWYTLGYCQSKLGRSEAEATLKQSLQLRPDWQAPKHALRECRKGFFRKIFGS